MSRILHCAICHILYRKSFFHTKKNLCLILSIFGFIRKPVFLWSVLSFFSLIDRDDDLMIVLDRFLALSNLHKTSYKNAKKLNGIIIFK